jgi:hypothetical protein
MTFPSQRGRILPPDLDDRNWADLVEEMMRLRQTYAPQWTDDNPSDLGVTLIELFAWLAEQVIYRLNRVPDKNYLAFLNLLGMTRYPATPASTYLTFTATGNNDTVAAGTQVQTKAAEPQLPVVFETVEPATVLPTELKSAVAITGPGKVADLTGTLVGPPAQKYIAAIPAGQTIVIGFGFTDSTTAEVVLNLQLSPPVRQAVDTKWTFSEKDTAPGSWRKLPKDPSDDTKNLQRSGKVRVRLPDTWARQNPFNVAGTAATDPFWVGLAVANPGATTLTVGLDRVLFNSALAYNALTISTPEQLGSSNGEPFQVFQLNNYPIFKTPGTDNPFGHVNLTVTVGDAAPTPWTLVDDFAPGEGNVYRLDPVTGEVLFGNFTTATPQGRQGHGSIPPQGSRIQAVYKYVAGGTSGNVAADQLVSPVKRIDGFNVTNKGAAAGGSDEESVDDALRRAPELLKTRDRAVTAQDYENLARTITDVSIVRCLPPKGRRTDDTAAQPKWHQDDPWRFGGLLRAPGRVYVVIVPDQGDGVARPEPPQELLDEVFRELDKRRDLTATLDVVGPRYLPVIVQADLEIFQDASDAGVTTTAIQDDTLDKVMAYLHPTRGGRDGSGWQIGQSVFVSDLFQAIKPDERTAYITSLTVSPAVPLYHLPPIGSGTEADFKFDDLTQRPFPSGSGSNAAKRASVRLADYELVCAADRTKHVINVNPPQGD